MWHCDGSRKISIFSLRFRLRKWVVKYLIDPANWSMYRVVEKTTKSDFSLINQVIKDPVIYSESIKFSN